MGMDTHVDVRKNKKLIQLDGKMKTFQHWFFSNSLSTKSSNPVELNMKAFLYRFVTYTRLQERLGDPSQEMKRQTTFYTNAKRDKHFNTVFYHGVALLRHPFYLCVRNSVSHLGQHPEIAMRPGSGARERKRFYTYVLLHPVYCNMMNYLNIFIRPHIEFPSISYVD